MTIHIITGGIGAGKSTLAKTLQGHIFAQADVARRLLSARFPGVHWFDRSQGYKDAPHPLLENRTPRSLIIEECERLVQEGGLDVMARMNLEAIRSLGASFQYTQGLFIVDDVRRAPEVQLYRAYDKADDRVVHWHVDGGIQDTQPTATPLPELRAMANYIISRGLPRSE